MKGWLDWRLKVKSIDGRIRALEKKSPGQSGVEVHVLWNGDESIIHTHGIDITYGEAVKRWPDDNWISIVEWNEANHQGETIEYNGKEVKRLAGVSMRDL